MVVEVTQPDIITVTAASDTAFNVTVTPAPAIQVTATTTGATGIQGPTGPQGDIGPAGPAGPGVPSGGLTGYRLTKKTDADYDTEWSIAATLPAGNDKAIQFNDGGVMGANDNFRFNKNTNTVVVGIPDALPNNPMAIGGALDDYLQVTIQNTSEGSSASGDLVITADNGDDDNYYLDLGMNSSQYDSVDYPAFKANDGYLIVEHGDLDLCSTKDKIKLVVGGTTEADIIAEVTSTGITMASGKTISDRPPVFYGTGSPPSAVGLPDGALFFKYTP